MSNLRDKVIKSFAWKKSSKHCAKRLGITVEKYQYIKDQVKAEILTFSRCKQTQIIKF